MKRFLLRLGGAVCGALGMLACAASQPAAEAEEIVSATNPILAAGRFYAAAPAPVVADGLLYLLSRRDKAAPDALNFDTPEWQLFATTDVASGMWQFTPHFLQPEALFPWAAPGVVYGGQIIRGAAGRYYLYALVRTADCPEDTECLAVGVAVADSVTGPWHDARPAGPLISENLPEGGDSPMADLTVLRGEKGGVYLYWCVYGQLQALTLKPDMITPAGRAVAVSSLKGFNGAPWLLQRRGSYYLAYAANMTDPKAGCTPAIYHACIAYASAPSPMGPWRYRGVILPPVSSASSHPGIIKFKDQWYIAYHTANGKGGGHFRRSVAIDKVDWDDSVTPAAIKPVVMTPAPPAVIGPQRNVAPAAQRFVSNTPVPVQYWDRALNDGIVRQNPLPPDMWGTWVGDNNPAKSWIAYLWNTPQMLNEARIFFWNDHPAGASIGVAPPKSWHLEYCQGRDWLPVQGASGYPTATHKFVSVSFTPVHTRCLRAVFEASGRAGKHAALAVEEWQVLAVHPQKVVVARQPVGQP